MNKTVLNGKSYGLSVAGYDIRIDKGLSIVPRCFELASSLEHFDMPKNVLGLVKDKSSWARQGLSVFNTVIEPGWRGYLTLELFNAGRMSLDIPDGCPIAQVLFYYTDEETQGYDGKYQDQRKGPVEAIYEKV